MLKKGLKVKREVPLPAVPPCFVNLGFNCATASLLAESFHLQLTCVLSPDTRLSGQQVTSAKIALPRHVCGR